MRSIFQVSGLFKACHRSQFRWPFSQNSGLVEKSFANRNAVSGVMLLAAWRATRMKAWHAFALNLDYHASFLQLHVHRNGSNVMTTISIKQEAQRLVENLPENATWDHLMYEIYLRQAIEAGLKDSDEGRTLDVKEVRAKFQ